MHPRRTPTRRHVSKAAGSLLLAGALAGCTGDGGDDEPTDTQSAGTDESAETNQPAAADDTPAGETPTDVEASPEDSDGDETSTEEATDQPDQSTLDLQEANVVDVDVTDDGDGRYRFAVTLHHDDDGEDGYANWWQVETPDGEQLGRRDLAHPHSRQPFTRSETVEVPASATCVVVRGHDQTHEYGGQVALVGLETGAVRLVQQGPEPGEFGPEDCP